MNAQEKIEQTEWHKNCEMVKEYSYAGVAVFLDAFPVTEGHMIFVPVNKDAGIDFCLIRASKIGKEMVRDGIWDGFNIGLNHGEAAGQTVDWPHVHLIPRMKGDCKDPAGGVRGVIPNRQNWKTSGRYKKKRRELGIDA